MNIHWCDADDSSIKTYPHHSPSKTRKGIASSSPPWPQSPPPTSPKELREHLMDEANLDRWDNTCSN